MNRKATSILLFIALLISACNQNVVSKSVQSNSPSIPTLEAVETKQPLSASVNLVFNPIQMEQLTEGKPDKNWELLKTIPFGEIKQQMVALDIYQEPKNPDFPIANKHAIIRFQDRNYPIHELISSELSETSTDDHSTMFLLQHIFSYLE
jgi:hypothetical protein